MPYSRKTVRRIGRHLITLGALTRANWQVTAEMDTLGLWFPRLETVDVCLVPVAFDCYGWFQPDQHIYIPAVNLAQLSDFFQGQHTRVTDVLRHEWAHALADRRPRLVDNRGFRTVFGGHYENQQPVEEYDPELHLTPYAAAMPCEDFAETFHFYLRHKGRLPLRLRDKPEIARKWAFIQWISESISG